MSEVIFNYYLATDIKIEQEGKKAKSSEPPTLHTLAYLLTLFMLYDSH